MSRLTEHVIYVDDVEVPFDKAELTLREFDTLCGKIVSYLDSCRERRKREEQDRVKLEARADATCIMCNDTGEIRRRVWSNRSKKFVYGKGMMPCPHCIEKSLAATEGGRV